MGYIVTAGLIASPSGSPYDECKIRSVKGGVTRAAETRIITNGIGQQFLGTDCTATLLIDVDLYIRCYRSTERVKADPHKRKRDEQKGYHKAETNIPLHTRPGSGDHRLPPHVPLSI